jgi:hypothetical protein
MTMSYGTEKFGLAVYTLATSPKSIQQRVAEAFMFSLINVNPDEDLPKELRAEFRALRDRVSREKPEYEGEGTIQATTRKFTDEETVDIARAIMEMASKVEEAAINSPW